MTLYIVILVLILYSVLITYLYGKERKNARTIGEPLENEVDIKVSDIRKRLEEVKNDANRLEKVEIDDLEV